MDELKQLETAIATLEAQRAVLGDAVVDAALAPMREKLAGLQSGQTASEQQLKFVSVLFADVVGSTHIGQHLDPEDIMTLIDGALRRLTHVIEGHGGQVRSFMGDGFMAVFGVPVAREDDAERAVRAGLALLAEARDYAHEIGSLPGGAGFDIRVGINTGQVILGGGVDRDTNALGMTTNLAARMQSAAPPGTLLITHDTYRQVQGLFHVQPQAPLQVKGRDDPVQAYLVLAAVPRSFHMRTRGVEGVQTPMIGRQAELSQLQAALAATRQEGTGRIVTISGEAGMGKSRLIDEFDAWVAALTEHAFYFKARAQPSTQDRPYALLRDLLSTRFHIQQSDPPQTVRERLEAGLAAPGPGDGALAENAGGQLSGLGRPAMRARFIGSLLGFDLDRPAPPATSSGSAVDAPLDAAGRRQLHDRGLAYLGDYLRALAAEDPVVILLEDLHWADDSSLDLLRDLGPVIAGARMLVICAARPSLFERRPHWGDGPAPSRRLDLAPLSPLESRRLVDEILRHIVDLPAELSELVVTSAEGNPFYIEELIKMLIEEGVIQKPPRVGGEDPGGAEWRVATGRLAQVRVPPTLVGILQARFDGLAPLERTNLQRASVIGRIFWDAALARLSPKAPAGVEAALQALRGREMIFQHEHSTFEGASEFIFKHALLRDVTYDSVLKRDRRVYHANAASWLEEVTERSGRADEYAALIAGHHERAGETERAVVWYARAGERAAGQYANAEAVRLFTHALDLLPRPDPDARTAAADERRFELQLARERARDLLADRQAQALDLADLAGMAEGLDAPRRAEVNLRRAHYADMTGDYAAATTFGRQTIELAQAAGRADQEVSGYLAVGRAYWRLAEYARAHAPLDQALALAADAGLSSLQADAARTLGIVYEAEGAYRAARPYYEQALALFRELGDPAGESRALNDLGALYYHKNEYHSARDYLEAALRLKQEIGDRGGESIVLNNLGNITQQEGDHRAAREYFERCLRLSRESLDPEGETAALLGLASVANLLGDQAGARAHFEQALALARRIGDRQGEADTLASLAQLACETGDPGQAEDYARQALQVALDVGAQRQQGFALTYLGQAMLALGRPDEAAEAYGQAATIRRELGEGALALDSLAGLAAAWMARESLSQAQAQVDEILGALEREDWTAMDDPFQVFLTCFRVLRESGDARAAPLLADAQARLQQRAARLGDEGQARAYVNGTRSHRELTCLEAKGGSG